MGNTEALWEQLTEGVARHILPQDEVATIVVAWLPFPETLQEFGARILDAGAAPRDPQLVPEVKICLLTRLTRPAQVAFETYALAHEVAVGVLTRNYPYGPYVAAITRLPRSGGGAVSLDAITSDCAEPAAIVG